MSQTEVAQSTQQPSQPTSAMTCEEQIRKYFTNFLAFLHDRRAIYPRLASLEGKFAPYLEADGIASFSLLIRDKIAPFASDIDNLLSTLLAGHGIPRADIKDEDYDKFKRYIMLFIKLTA